MSLSCFPICGPSLPSIVSEFNAFLPPCVRPSLIFPAFVSLSFPLPFFGARHDVALEGRVFCQRDGVSRFRWVRVAAWEHVVSAVGPLCGERDLMSHSHAMCVT